MANGRSGAVQLVFSVKDEEDLECPDEFGVGLEVVFIELIHHVEEVLDISCFLMRLVVLSPNTVSVGVGSDGRHSSQQSIDLFVPHLLVLVDRLPDQAGVLLGVKRGERGDGTAQHAHGMSIVPEGVHH